MIDYYCSNTIVIWLCLHFYLNYIMCCFFMLLLYRCINVIDILKNNKTPNLRLQQNRYQQ